MAFALLLIAACSTQDDVVTPSDDDQIIHIGGVSTTDMVATTTATRADATFPEWLNDGLKVLGMDMVYNLGSNEQHAKLKYDGSAYSLKEYNSIEPCKWLGNGAHIFRGAYVPESLRVQNTAKTYEDLCHYTSLPPKHVINATIDKITIPMQHRLARVVAYVLIDNSIKNVNGAKAKLKGYDADATRTDNTKLRFCDVYVLNYVDASGHPVWKTETRAVPHFVKEETITVYQEKGTNNYVFPTDANYQSVSANSGQYTPIPYGVSPCYDLIVRPTYKVATNKANVMGDELTENDTDTKKNKIRFDLTLDNDLEYEKEVEIDLNANDETVVYLRISPEKIDYNSTGSRLWQSKSYADDYYGVDNENHSLSYAGSSWQRAYTNGTTNPAVTDGNAYSNQHVSDADWIELLKVAKDGGSSAGKYFILQNDITIDVSGITGEFVFKGHLDGLNHTITLTGTDARNYLFDDMGTRWDSELLNVKVVGGTLFKIGVTPTGHVNNCWDGSGRIKDITPEIPTY